ncbi:MAG TPA: ribosome silencing factor [Candidatus Saccharimonadales bacterium]|nr:ribosome silencing factor [Candidatus Saccharimonadales bacterium]
MTSRQLAERCARLLFEKKAEDIQVLDLRKLSAVTDFFVVASATSSPHVRALGEHVEDTLRRAGHRPWHTEGYPAERWVLLDYVNVVVHIFHPQTREFYLLERLWGDAEKVKVDYHVPERSGT